MKHSFVFAIFLFVCSVSRSVCEQLPRFEHSVKNDDSLRFLVVGDWGRRGLYNQSKVAHQMGLVGEKLDIDFVISTGDNFYDEGLTGVNDPAFDASFSRIYTAPSLQTWWYNVLGNHDYMGDVEAQLGPVLTHRDWRWFCSRSFFLDSGNVEFFFVDTTPFVNEYFIDPGSHTFDWRGVLPRENYLSNLLKELDSALKKSEAIWKITVGHHAIKSAGHHGSTQELVDRLLPILEANDVDMYINGHDHCLEHITSNNSNIQFLTSGGGSKAWRGDEKKWDPEQLKLFYDGQGFMSMEITSNKASFRFYDIFGKVLHSWNISKYSQFY